MEIDESQSRRGDRIKTQDEPGPSQDVMLMNLCRSLRGADESLGFESRTAHGIVEMTV